MTLELSREQALVFFEWLSKLNATESRRFEDQAEERVLWDIEATLELALEEPLDSRAVLQPQGLVPSPTS